jgi:hypothetical protein
LDVAQTWSALQSHNDNDLAVNGATSGNLVLRAAAIAGSSVVRFPAGSTDFSATGGTGQYVKQISAGAALTVAAIAAADLPLATTGAFGAVKPDGTTITIAGGIITASGGSATAVTLGTTDVSAGAAVAGGVLSNAAGVLQNVVLTNHIGGLTLSNDSGTPNSVLDIAAGSAMDSTNAALIPLGAFTKSTAGAWASGTAGNGMGNGLTITASTWYHVFLANNGGIPDVFFDTSVTGANRPSAITDAKIRRIGSFRTDASAHILKFTQIGNNFTWFASTLDVNAGGVSTSPGTETLTVPGGVKVVANILVYLVSSSASQYGILIQSPDQNPVEAGSAAGLFTLATTSAVQVSSSMQVGTNTISQIGISGDIGSALTVYINTVGWTDYRGQL